MTPKKTRLHRSELAVPGSNVQMLEKAPTLGADIVMLDLEDAVAPDDKEQARVNVIAALRDLDWSAPSVSVRINGLDTHFCYRDIVDVVEQAGDQIDTIVIPKASGAGDVHLVATLLSQIEPAVGLRRQIGLAVLIETAIGMVNVDEIARACPERMEAMIFGVADYAASVQARTTSIGGVDEGYSVLTNADDEAERERHWGDQWHYPLARIAVTCRAHGLRPIDGPFGDFTDPEGYLVGGEARGGARLRGQVGDPPLADRARERGLHARRAPGREDPRDHRCDERGGGRGQGRGLAQRPADRRRVDPDGREPARQARADRAARHEGDGGQRAAAPARVRDQLGDRQAPALGDPEPSRPDHPLTPPPPNRCRSRPAPGRGLQQFGGRRLR